MSEVIGEPRPAKPLSEMSLEELWHLFPIILRSHNSDYAHWFREQADELARIWGVRAVRISHMGSTAVRGLLAKPTVDILLELAGEVAPREAIDVLSEAGWSKMSGMDGEPMQLSFNKGYTPEGFADQVFHLHVRRAGDPDELYFRDYLQDNQQACADYEQLKRDLSVRFTHDRDGYTNAKSDFVRETTARARELYGMRYAPTKAAVQPAKRVCAT